MDVQGEERWCSRRGRGLHHLDAIAEESQLHTDGVGGKTNNDNCFDKNSAGSRNVPDPIRDIRSRH